MVRDRDYIVDTTGNILRVIGDNHPINSVLSFMKYSPSIHGTRIVDGKTYKYNTFVNRSIGMLKEEEDRVLYADCIGNVVSATPNEKISRVFSCRKKVEYIMNNQEKYISHPVGKYLIEYLRLSSEKINLYELGVTGSFLLDFQNEKSDIDLVCYGEMAYNELVKLFKFSDFIQKYEDGLQEFIYERRMTHMAEMGKEALILQESRKLQGRIKGTDIHINCQPLREDEAVVKLSKMIELGEISCVVKIIEDKEGKYAPAIYKIMIDKIIDSVVVEDVWKDKIEYLISYLGDFSQIFRIDDKVYLEGKVVRFCIDNKLLFGIEMTSWNTNKRYKAQLIF